MTLLVLVCTTLSFLAHGGNLNYIGKVKYDGGLLFIESHQFKLDPNNQPISSVTEYKKPSGEVFARLENTFKGHSSYLPVYTLTDSRLNQTHGVGKDSQGYYMFRKQKDRERKIIRPADLDKPILGSQGLHFFIRDHFKELTSKKGVSKKLTYYFPSELDYLTLKIEYQGKKNNLYHFEIELNNWFLSLFAPSIKIQYDLKKRIHRFEGLSNIKSDSGRLLNVIVDYEYAKIIE